MKHWDYKRWKTYGIHLDGSHAPYMWAQALTHLNTVFKDTEIETMADIGCGYPPLDLQKASEFNSVKKIIRVDGLNYPRGSGSDTIEDLRLCDLNKEAIPISDNSVDFVIAFELIEHLFDTHKFLSELSRISTKGFLISKPNTDLKGVDSHWYGRENFYDTKKPLFDGGARYEHVNFIPNYELEGFGDMLGYTVICMDAADEGIQFFWFSK